MGAWWEIMVFLNKTCYISLMPTTTMVEKWPRTKALKLRAIMENMGLCPCGSATEWECVLEILEAYETRSDAIRNGDRWYEFAAKALDSWGLTEHGTSVAYGWLTDDGKILLEFLRDFGTESCNFETGSGHPEWSAEFSWHENADPKVLDSYAQWALTA